MFRKIYQNDFCEEVHISARSIFGDMEEISKDNKMFLAIVEKGTKKVDENYDVPLPYRDGNPLEYHNFMTLFHELVGKRTDDPGGRLTQLIRYTKGDPKDMIQHCVQQPPSVRVF